MTAPTVTATLAVLLEEHASALHQLGEKVRAYRPGNGLPEHRVLQLSGDVDCPTRCSGNRAASSLLLARAMSRKSSARRAPEYPALTAWRAELLRGERTALTFDSLWRAACLELNAQELAGFVPEVAQSYRAKATRILQDAARAQRKARAS